MPSETARCVHTSTHGPPQASSNVALLITPLGTSTDPDTATMHAGIAASFYNPSQPGAETLAVYFKPTDAADTKALGTAQVSGAGTQGTARVASGTQLACPLHMQQTHKHCTGEQRRHTGTQGATHVARYTWQDW